MKQKTNEQAPIKAPKKTITIDLPEELIDLLDAKRAIETCTRTFLITHILNKYFLKEESET